MPTDPSLPISFDRAHALACGVSRHQIPHRVRQGEWLRLARGRYALAAQFADLPENEQHVLRLEPLLQRRGPSDVASHLSGALLHGWGLPFDGPGPPTVTSGDLTRSAHRRPGLVVQVASLPPEDVVELRAVAAGTERTLRATSEARTLADCLRHLPPEDSVALVDGALRSGGPHRDAIRGVLERQDPWPYLARGTRALALVDPRRESYLESFSFVRLAAQGIAMPQPQVSIFDDTGGFVARVDGWLAEFGVVLEADGAAKYLLDDRLGTGESRPAVVVRAVERSFRAQYEREALLTRLGLKVVRWTTAQIMREPAAVARRVRAACAAPPSGPLRAVAVPAEVHPSCA